MKLTKPIAIIDLETTGKEIATARIVEIGIVIISPQGKKTEKRRLINPGLPIPAEATEIHGIKDEDVADAPKFIEIHKALFAQLQGCDIAGYSSDRFDIPILVEEFARCGVDFPETGTRTLDVLKLERHHNSHKLEEVYKRRTGKVLEGAHGALTDAKATAEVLFSILEQEEDYNEETTADQLIELLADKDADKRCDYAGKLKYNDAGDIVWNFGPHYEKEVLSDIGFFNWVLAPKADGKGFPFATCRILMKYQRQKYDEQLSNSQEPPPAPEPTT